MVPFKIQVCIGDTKITYSQASDENSIISPTSALLICHNLFEQLGMIAEPTAGEHGLAREEKDQDRIVAQSTRNRWTCPQVLVKDALFNSFPPVGILTVIQCPVQMTLLQKDFLISFLHPVGSCHPRTSIS